MSTVQMGPGFVFCFLLYTYMTTDTQFSSSPGLGNPSEAAMTSTSASTFDFSLISTFDSWLFLFLS